MSSFGGVECTTQLSHIWLNGSTTESPSGEDEEKSCWAGMQLLCTQFFRRSIQRPERLPQSQRRQRTHISWCANPRPNVTRYCPDLLSAAHVSTCRSPLAARPIQNSVDQGQRTVAGPALAGFLPASDATIPRRQIVAHQQLHSSTQRQVSHALRLHPCPAPVVPTQSSPHHVADHSLPIAHQARRRITRC